MPSCWLPGRPAWRTAPAAPGLDRSPSAAPTSQWAPRTRTRGRSVARLSFFWWSLPCPRGSPADPYRPPTPPTLSRSPSTALNRVFRFLDRLCWVASYEQVPNRADFLNMYVLQALSLAPSTSRWLIGCLDRNQRRMMTQPTRTLSPTIPSCRRT